MILEFGSVEDPASSTHKAAWYKDVQALFKTPAYSHYVALLQWAGTNTYPKCSFNYNTSATSQAAWAAIGRDPSYIVPYSARTARSSERRRRRPRVGAAPSYVSSWRARLLSLRR